VSGPTELAAQATAASASALFVSIVGVEPQVMIWALVGSIIGVTLAKPAGRLYATLLFGAATLTCALLGTIAGDAASPGSALARNAFAVVFGVIFHPGVAALISLVPDIVAWGVKRVQRVFGSEQ
jgi:hypothetical protein